MKFAQAPMPRDQINLIPTTLGDLIPEDHPLRLLDELLGQMDWSVFEPNYRRESRGRPAIPPRILASVWIYAHFRGVRSSRQLEYQVKTNIEFMWLAHGHQIDHTTLAIFRKNHKDAIKQIHRDLIRFVKDLGVIRIAELYVDATRIGADASRFRTMTAERARKLLEIIQHEIDTYLEKIELQDEADALFENGESGEQLPDHLRTLEQRKARCEQMLQLCEEEDERRRKKGTDPEKNPFQIPVTDPDSRILPNKEGGYAPNYTPLVGVEGELGLIVSSTIINSVNEQDYLVSTIDDVEQAYRVTVKRVGADAAYSTGSNIVELEVNREIDFLSPHRNGDVPEDNPAIRDDPTQPVPADEVDRLPVHASRKTFSNEAFVFDAEKDIYYCPQGREMHRAYQEKSALGNGEIVTRTIYQCPSCEDCPVLELCRGTGKYRSGRRVTRDEYEVHRARHRAKMSTAEAKQRYSRRLSPGERIFGHIKSNLGFRRFHTRGTDSVESEFAFVVLAHNLRRISTYFGSVAGLRARLAESR